MFAAHADRLRARARTVRLAVQTAAGLRRILDDPTIDPAAWPDGPGRDAGRRLREPEAVPSAAAWGEYDSDAAVTLLYAAYEHCVKELIREWVRVVMPVRWPSFTADDFPSRAAYVAGFVKVLPELGPKCRAQYRHLNPEDISRDYADAAAGRPYRLHPELFLTANRNLRHGDLVKLLGEVGLVNAWQWVVKHRDMIDYHQTVIGGANSLANELNQFVEERNQAAHGGSGTYLSTERLVQYTHFVERLGVALVEKARHDMYRHYLSAGQAEEIGRVFHVYPRAQAVAVEAAGVRRLAVGEPVGLLTANGCDFQPFTGCELDRVPHDTADLVATQQFTLRFGRLPSAGTTLVRVTTGRAAGDDAGPRS